MGCHDVFFNTRAFCVAYGQKPGSVLLSKLNFTACLFFCWWDSEWWTLAATFTGFYRAVSFWKMGWSLPLRQNQLLKFGNHSWYNLDWYNPCSEMMSCSTKMSLLQFSSQFFHLRQMRRCARLSDTVLPSMQGIWPSRREVLPRWDAKVFSHAQHHRLKMGTGCRQCQGRYLFVLVVVV